MPQARPNPGCKAVATLCRKSPVAVGPRRRGVPVVLELVVVDVAERSMSLNTVAAGESGFSG